MRYILLLLMLCVLVYSQGLRFTAAVPVSSPFSLVQWSYLQDVVNDVCTAGSLTCTVPFSKATASGSTIMLGMGTKGFSGGAPTISSVWMCSTNPCTSNTSGATWVSGLSGAPWTIAGGSPTHSVDVAYTLTNSGTWTFMTVTRTAGTISFWGITISEVLCLTACGSVHLDAVGSPTGSNSCTSCTGSSFSSVGKDDAILQELDVDQLATNPTVPYVVTPTTQWLYALGNVTNAAPTFTQTPIGQSLVPALAFSPR